MRDRTASLVAWASILVSLALAVATPSCTPLRGITASPEDYDRYRRIRLSKNFLERLGAAWRYLKHEHEGAFRPEVEGWFRAADERYLVRNWNDPSNLERYLAELEDAPRSGIVRARIDQLVALRARVAREENEFLESEKQRQRAFEEARTNRHAFVRSVRTWAETLARLADFGHAASDWDPAFKNAFFEQSVRGNCQGDVCSKPFLRGFDVPRQDGLETRAVDFDLILTLKNGKLFAAELSGHGLFDRLAEATTSRVVDPGDLQARAEAIGTATELLTMSLSVGFPDATCEREAVSPVIIARECDGRAIFAIVAERPEQRDRIVIVASPGAR